MVTRVEENLVQELEEGNVKYASKRQTVAASGTESFLIEAPSATDLKASVISLEFTAGAQFTIDVTKNVAVDTAGSEMVITNAKTGGDSTTNLNLHYGGGYSGGTSMGELLMPGGTTGGGLSGSASDPIRTVVNNGDNILIQATNNGSSSAPFGVEIVFVGRPVN